MLTLNEITKRITSINNRRVTWNNDVQTVLANLAGHAYEHGDVRKVADLLNACKGADKVAIVGYLRDNCFVNVDKEGKVTLNKKARKEADFVDGDAVVAYLSEQPTWFDRAITTADAAKILDPVKRIESMIKQVQKGDHDIKFVESDFNDAVARLNAAIAQARVNQSLIAEDGSVAFSDAV